MIVYDEIIGMVDNVEPYEFEDSICTFASAEKAADWGQVVLDEGRTATFCAMRDGDCVGVISTVYNLMYISTNKCPEDSRWVKKEIKPSLTDFEYYVYVNPYEYNASVELCVELDEVKDYAIQECRESNEDMIVYGLIKIGTYKAPTTPIWEEV